MKSEEQKKLELLQNTTINELSSMLRARQRAGIRKKLMMSKGAGAIGPWMYEPIDSDAKFELTLKEHSDPTLQLEQSQHVIVTWRGKSEYHISAGLLRKMDDIITSFGKAGADVTELRKAQRATKTRERITSHIDEYRIIDSTVFTRSGWSFLKEDETDIIEEGYEWAAAGPQESSLIGKDWYVMHDILYSEKEAVHVPLAVVKIVDPKRAKRIEKARKARMKRQKRKK